MRKHLCATSLLCLLATTTPLLAQTATGTGVGTGISGSNSESGAIAINKGNGGNATATGTGVGIADSKSQSGAIAAGNQVNISSPANTTSSATVNSTVSGTTTSNINSRVSGTQTVRSAPPIAAPGLTAAGIESCNGSWSGGVSVIGTGITGGSTVKDEECNSRLDARTLYSMGLKAAALNRLCSRAVIWVTMPDICAQYWPQGMPYPVGIAYAGPVGAPAGLPVRALMSADGASAGIVRVIDGRDGVEKDCLNYNAGAQKCTHWLGESPRKRKPQVANVQAPQRISVKPKPPAAPKIEPKTEPAKSDPAESEKKT